MFDLVCGRSHSLCCLYDEVLEKLKWPNRNYSDASVERGLAKGGRYQKMTTYLYLASRVKDGINLQSTSSLQGYRLRGYDTRTYFASLPVASAASTSSTRNSN